MDVGRKSHRIGPFLIGPSFLCVTYNNLPQNVVDASSVRLFQRMLTQEARQRCEDGYADWALSFSRRAGPDT